MMTTMNDNDNKNQRKKNIQKFLKKISKKKIIFFQKKFLKNFLQ